MRPSAIARAISAVALTVLAACSSDSKTGVLPTTPAQRKTAPTSIASLAVAPTPGTCSTLADLQAKAIAAFGAGSPDVNSVLGKIGNLATLVSSGDYAGAKTQAYNIIDFTLKKNGQRALGGSIADITSFLNTVACYAGLTFTFTDPANSYLIFPSDGAQILIASDGLAGISLQANPVSEPTLLTIAPIPFTSTVPGAGPLTTKLDQYLGFYEFKKYSDTNLPLTKPAIVGVCAPSLLDPAILTRLRLGHDASYGFEITPVADAGFLSCANAYASREPAATPSGSLFGGVLSLFTPRVAFAASATMFYGGGVGGLVTELSPFAPVDPVLSFSGGVGGTVTELKIMQQASPLIGCLATEAPIGTGLGTECRPKVTLKTYLGTPLSGAPITFTVETGGGVVAAQDASLLCVPPFGNAVTTPTLSTGQATVCWTLGTTPGQNSLRARGGIGGDVPSGVTYTNSILFTATAKAPSGFSFLVQPAAGSAVAAGNAIPLSVAAVDAYGTTALGYTGAVTVALNKGTFANGTASITANAVSGVVTLPNLSITTAGTGYQLIVTADFFGNVVSAAGNTFDIVPAAANGLAIAGGNAQTALAGTVLPINPAVVVTDFWGNLVPGATIAWAAGGSSGGSVAPTSSLTGANGQAVTAWTVGAGANELRATLSRGGTLGDVSVLFTATGTSPALVTLNQCVPGGSGDPFNDPAKPYAFYIPDPGNGKTIKQIQLYISSAGQANAPASYRLRLDIQRGTFDPALSASTPTEATVFLRGNNSESKPVTFVLANPIIGANGSGAKAVMMRLSAITNPDGAKLSFNTGACSPGKCNPPPGCNATEVSSPLPYPVGTLYRKSVGLVVTGN